MSDGLLFDKQDHIARLTINRPEAMNAMDPETYRALSEAWMTVRDDPDIWVAVITGAGDLAFSAGADLKKAFAGRDLISEHFGPGQPRLLNRGLEVFKPVIAAVNGFCLGGGLTLLLACDLRVAAEHASFGLSEVKRGVLPANGGAVRTPRQLPWAVAMELLLIGDRIDAQQALHWGLVNRVVPLAELMPTALDYARRLCANAPLAVRTIKEIAVRTQTMPLDEALRYESMQAAILRETADAKEGRLAFAEKRPPRWQGR